MWALNRVISTFLRICRTMEQYVKNQWISTCNEVGVTRNTSLKWWEYIATKYKEEQRHYHTLQHIHDMLLHVASYRHLLASPSDVTLAVFFHE